MSGDGWPRPTTVVPMAREQDLKRIEEERAGVARPAPASLASSHLLQALEAFDDACTPEALLTSRRSWPLKPGDPPSAWRTLAGVRQRSFCCTSTLFAAFAAEAYVNDFLSVHLKPKVSTKRFDTVDRWPTLRKYTKGVEQAYACLFRQGDEVMSDLERLFAVRNQLAHGRPGTGPPMAHMPDPAWRELYPPIQVASWLVAVAGAASLMERRCYGFDYESVPASAIWHGRNLVREHAERGTPLPAADSTGQAPLLQRLYAEAKRQSQAVCEPMTVDELREVRLRLAAENGPWDTFTGLVQQQPPRAEDER